MRILCAYNSQLNIFSILSYIYQCIKGEHDRNSSIYLATVTAMPLYEVFVLVAVFLGR